MFRQLLTIARNAFVESIRQPVFAVLIFVGIIMLVLNPSLSGYTFEHGTGDNKLMIDISMSTVMLICTLLAAFTAAGVISNEIENKTVLTTVSKPVARPIFVLGKFVGVSSAVAVAFWALMLIFLMTVRHGVMSTASDHFDEPVLTFSIIAGLIAIVGAAAANFYYRWVFTSTFVVTLAITQTVAWALVLVVGKDWGIQSPAAEFVKDDSFLPQLHVALALIFQSILLITAVAIAASTRLGQVMTLIITIAFWLCSQAVSTTLQEFSEKADSTDATVAGVLAPFIPNNQYMWHADALTQGHALSGQHFMLISLYTGLFIVAVLFIAIALFQTREVG